MRIVRRNHRFYDAVACLSGALASVLSRLIEYPRWIQQELQVNGEWLLATHDAYFWVAGAEGLNAAAEPMPMANLLDGVGRALSLSPADLAFWTSILLPSLVALPLALWASHLGSSRAVWFVPFLGTLAPAYFLRTRLGFYDTDWATLFFPLLIGWLLAIWMSPRLSIHSRVAPASQISARTWYVPVVLVLVISIAVPWHTAIGLFAIGALGLAGLLVALFGKIEFRASSQWVLIACALALLEGGWGIFLALLLVLWLAQSKHEVPNQAWATLAFGVLAVLLVVILNTRFHDYVSSLVPTYIGVHSDESSGRPGSGELVFPELATSVMETQEPGLTAALGLAAFHPLLGVAGAIGYFHLLTKRPTLIVLLPMLTLGLASIWMGMRFAIFASPILVLGLAIPLERISELAVQRFERVKWGRVLAPAVLVVGLGGLTYAVVGRQPVEAVIGKQHAQALSSLGELADSQSTIWAWWDYGYASQHFARMGTFADGRRNSGKYLFSLGSVLGSQSIDRSAEFMRFSADHENFPWKAWEDWSGAQMGAWLEAHGQDQPRLYQSTSPHYLVVQWEAIPALPWISYYGSWDFENHQGIHSRVLQVEEPYRLDLETGVLHFVDELYLRAATVDVLDKRGSRHLEYPRNSGAPHILLNKEDGSVVVLDGLAYGSTLVQLLIVPEDQLERMRQFNLVVDKAPFVRIFELN